MKRASLNAQPFSTFKEVYIGYFFGILSPCLGNKLCSYEFIFHVYIDEKQTIQPFCLKRKLFYQFYLEEFESKGCWPYSKALFQGQKS